MTFDTSRNYGLFTDLDRLANYVDLVMSRDMVVGFDVETGYYGPDREKGSLQVDWERQFVCGFSVSHHPLFGRYIPLAHDAGPNVEDAAAAWEIMRPLLTRGKLVIHNKKFERRNVQKAAGYIIGSDGGTIVDTMLDAYILSEYSLNGVINPDTGQAIKSVRGANGLKDLTKILFDYDQPKIESLFPGYTQKQIDCLRFNKLELTPAVVAYCCDDAAWALALFNHYSARAKSERRKMWIIENAIADIMADVEMYGVHVEWEEMEVALGQAKTFRPALERAVKEGLGALAKRDLTSTNLGSSKQLQALLYRDIGLATTRMTKGAEKKADLEPWQQMSTDAIAMEGLSKTYPEIRALLDMREVENLEHRLEKWLREFRYATDDRVHANYSQVTVGTGRFAANDPPIQQCPKEWRWTTVMGADIWKEDKETHTYPEWDRIVAEGTNGLDYWGGNFRDFISAKPGFYLLTYDYSQIELRVLAGESQEPALLKAFNEDQDVHTITAAMMLGKKPEDVDKKTERPIGKTMNFALLYGMGIKSLAERLAVTVTKAKALNSQYFAAFSRISSWQNEATRKGVHNGYAETRFGRKYEVWELRSDNQGVRNKALRVFTNAPIQGGAADYMKIAMMRAARALKERGWWMTKCTIIMNQHDSLSFEVSNDLDPQEVRDLLEEQVVFPIKGFPKIVADWELGQRWGSSTSWKAGMRPHWDGERWQLVSEDGSIAQPESMCFHNPNILKPAETQDAWLADQYTLSVASEPEEGHTGNVITSLPEAVPSKGRTVIVTETTLTKDMLGNLLKYMALKPGGEETWLETPQGELRLGLSCLSAHEDSGRISLILSGAKIRREASEMDLAMMASGLT